MKFTREDSRYTDFIFQKQSSKSDYIESLVGKRVKLVKTNDPYTDLANNEYIGTVYDVNKVNFDGGFTQIWCRFDNGSNFAIVPESGDIYEVL